VFDPRVEASPCYHCVYPDDQNFEETSCALMGVFAPIVGIIGATQAAEALKVIIGCGDPLVGRLLLLDGLSMEWQTMRVKRNTACAVCGDASA